MKHHLAYSLLFSLSLCAPFAHADWLDDKDQQFEQVFQKSDAAFEKAMHEGVKELDAELATIWGDVRQLPDAKVWVGYSKDIKRRIIVDYDRGEMSIEGFETEERDLFNDLQDILIEDNDQLDERAALRKKLIEKTDQFWKDDEDSDFQSGQRKKRTRSTWKPSFRFEDTAPPSTEATKVKHELSNLIDPKVRPTFVKRSVAFSKGKTVQLSRLTIPLRKDRELLSAQILQKPIQQAARKYKLPQSLILSVIKNESAFNPRARSHANALGLMQLVPTSGGKEAYSYLMGKELTPSPEILYDPLENILLGATYLHLLDTRYFGKVQDKKTRQYLIIAAYNTGAGNVAKAFTGKMKLGPAIRKINTMSAQDVYAHLLASLPYAETKTYLARVSKDTRTFSDWDNRA